MLPDPRSYLSYRRQQVIRDARMNVREERPDRT
jgi:hypothetical protein